MKSTIVVKVIVFLVVVFFSRFTFSDQYILAVPASLKSQVERESLFAVARDTLMAISTGDVMRIINASSNKTIITIAIPEKKAFQYKKYRKRKLKKQLAQLKQGLDNIPIISEENQSISLPQFLDYISTEIFVEPIDDTNRANVLVYGNALYNDKKEEAFSMSDGWFPSDGHIRAGLQRSVFGTLEKRQRLKNFFIHFAYSNQYEDWVSDLYKYRIERFWSLYIKAMSGSLSTFSPDLFTTVDRFLSSGLVAAKSYQYDHTANKVERLKVWRQTNPEVSNVSNIVEDMSRPPSCLSEDTVLMDRPPIEKSAANVIVGIRWNTEGCENCDLDLYTTLIHRNDWLFYRNTEESYGRYFKDYTSPTNKNGLEFVQLTEEVMFEDIKAMVNFYDGKAVGGEVSGTLRICFNGNTYEEPFTISSSSGNKGGGLSEASSSQFWNVIDIDKVLKIGG